MDKRIERRAKAEAKPYHLILLAENEKQYKNLTTLVTKARLEGFYYKPRVDSLRGMAQLR